MGRRRAGLGAPDPAHTGSDRRTALTLDLHRCVLQRELALASPIAQRDGAALDLAAADHREERGGTFMRALHLAGERLWPGVEAGADARGEEALEDLIGEGMLSLRH